MNVNPQANSSQKLHAYEKSSLLSASATALDDKPCKEVMALQNRHASVALLIGDAEGQYISLAAGAFLPNPLLVYNLNQIYVKAASGTDGHVAILYRE